MLKLFRRIKYELGLTYRSELAPSLRYDSSATVLVVLDSVTARLKHA